MITKQQWDTLTPQQQYDYVRLLEDTVDALELDGDGEDEDTQEVVPVSDSGSLIAPSADFWANAHELSKQWAAMVAANVHKALEAKP